MHQIQGTENKVYSNIMTSLNSLHYITMNLKVKKLVLETESLSALEKKENLIINRDFLLNIAKLSMSTRLVVMIEEIERKDSKLKGKRRGGTYEKRITIKSGLEGSQNHLSL